MASRLEQEELAIAANQQFFEELANGIAAIIKPVGTGQILPHPSLELRDKRSRTDLLKIMN